MNDQNIAHRQLDQSNSQNLPEVNQPIWFSVAAAQRFPPIPEPRIVPANEEPPFATRPLLVLSKTQLRKLWQADPIQIAAHDITSLEAEAQFQSVLWRITCKNFYSVRNISRGIKIILKGIESNDICYIVTSLRFHSNGLGFVHVAPYTRTLEAVPYDDIAWPHFMLCVPIEYINMRLNAGTTAWMRANNQKPPRVRRNQPGVGRMAQHLPPLYNNQPRIGNLARHIPPRYNNQPHNNHMAQQVLPLQNDQAIIGHEAQQPPLLFNEPARHGRNAYQRVGIADLHNQACEFNRQHQEQNIVPPFAQGPPLPVLNPFANAPNHINNPYLPPGYPPMRFIIPPYPVQPLPMQNIPYLPYPMAYPNYGPYGPFPYYGAPRAEERLGWYMNNGQQNPFFAYF